MRVDTFPLGPLETNCFLASHLGRALAVDPGGDPAPVLTALKRAELALDHIVITHMHCDHIYGAKALADATGAPILANPEDAYLLETELGAGGFMGLPRVDAFDYDPLTPGETLLMGRACTVLATPGHTRGSVSLYFPRPDGGPDGGPGHLFTGDLLFYRGVGRTDFPGGDWDTLVRSVKDKVFSLPDDTVVHAGHGPDTTVGDEKRNNPYFTEFTR